MFAEHLWIHQFLRPVVFKMIPKKNPWFQRFRIKIISLTLFILKYLLFHFIIQYALEPIADQVIADYASINASKLFCRNHLSNFAASIVISWIFSNWNLNISVMRMTLDKLGYSVHERLLYVVRWQEVYQPIIHAVRENAFRKGGAIASSFCHHTFSFLRWHLHMFLFLSYPRQWTFVHAPSHLTHPVPIRQEQPMAPQLCLSLHLSFKIN